MSDSGESRLVDCHPSR